MQYLNLLFFQYSEFMSQFIFPSIQLKWLHDLLNCFLLPVGKFLQIKTSRLDKYRLSNLKSTVGSMGQNEHKRNVQQQIYFPWLIFNRMPSEIWISTCWPWWVGVSRIILTNIYCEIRHYFWDGAEIIFFNNEQPHSNKLCISRVH